MNDSYFVRLGHDLFEYHGETSVGPTMVRTGSFAYKILRDIYSNNQAKSNIITMDQYERYKKLKLLED